VSPHDPVGTNVFGHVLRGRLMRVVARENEAINETWIADRDRFSYEGIYSEDRLRQPMVRRGSEWVEVDWESALMAAAEGLKARAADLGVLASSSGTLEELYLTQRLARGLGTNNVDHRLRQRDFRDQAADPVFPGLGMPVAEVDGLDGLLVIGSHLRREAPILAHRLRKAARRGAQVSFLNPARFTYLFPVKSYLVAAASDLVGNLAAVLAAAAQAAGKSVPAHLAGIVNAASVTDEHRAVAQSLLAGEKRAVWLGALAGRHARFADLRSLAAGLAAVTDARLGRIAEGGNAAGAYLAGAVPHREAGTVAVATPGLNAREMLGRTLSAYLMVGGIEPSVDALDPESLRKLAKAEFIVAITPFASAEIKAVAHLMLPMGTFAETSGTYVNCSGLWQSQAGAAAPVGEARPGWKILRVLGNLLNLPGFEYQSSEEVLSEVRERCAQVVPAGYQGTHAVNGAAGGDAAPGLVDLPMYQADAVVRRAPSLQRTREGRTPAVAY
jgi:NADH-quinone oxidoreductase subunit G